MAKCVGVKSRPKELTPLDYDRKIVKNARKSARKKNRTKMYQRIIIGQLIQVP